MSVLLLFSVLVAIIAVFSMAALKWGTDSREWTTDRIVATAFSIR